MTSDNDYISRLYDALRDETSEEGTSTPDEAFVAHLSSALRDETVTFAPFFAQRTLARIEASAADERPPTFSELFIRYLARVVVPVSAAALLLLSINMATGGAFSVDAALGIDTPTLADYVDPLGGLKKVAR